MLHASWNCIKLPQDMTATVNPGRLSLSASSSRKYMGVGRPRPPATAPTLLRGGAYHKAQLLELQYQPT